MSRYQCPNCKGYFDGSHYCTGGQAQGKSYKVYMYEPKENKMTREEILKMPVGREMDALIDDAIFEYGIGGGGGQYSEINKIYIVPDYSTDIAAAWLVVEKMDKKGFHFTVSTVDGISTFSSSKGGAYCYGDTVPLAICRAALLAVMGDE